MRPKIKTAEVVLERLIVLVLLGASLLSLLAFLQTLLFIIKGVTPDY
jgi:hypothetical protein